MRFLQTDFDFAVTDRRIADDGTISAGGVARYESNGRVTSGAPRGWSVTLSFFPFRLESDLEISNGSGAAFSVAELHQFERGAGLPAPEHNLYESTRDTNGADDRPERAHERRRR